ncbi:hypothetical protein [Arenimonas alkanexedens]
MSPTGSKPSSTADANPSPRDLFAAHIAAALIQAPKQAGVPRLERDALARQAFEFADAMMQARSA